MKVMAYKKVTTSTSGLKKEAEELREIYVQENEIDKYLKQEQFKFKLGYFLFWGTILFGIGGYFILGGNTKKSAGKNKGVNFNLIKFG